MTAVPHQHRENKAGRGQRANAVARFFRSFGLIECKQTRQGSNVLLTDKYAIRVEGARAISGKRTPAMVLRDLLDEYPGRVPVLVRTVHPEVEQATVHMQADDFRKLLAWDEREMRLK